MKFWRTAMAAVAGLMLVTAARAEQITVSAAVSLKDVLTAIAWQYRTDSGEGVTFVFGSSGQLATQIKDGAEVDLFISAANKQVDDLVKAGAAEEASRKVVAGNTLVLIVPAGAKDVPGSFADLADGKYGKIALGEPNSVPAGEYAMQTLTKLKIADQLKDRLVYGTNVRQVLAYVEDADVGAGIVYATDAKESGDKVKVAAVADEKTHEPIVYPAVVIKGSRKQEAAQKFLAYLQGAAARKVLTEQGFAVPAEAGGAATATAATTVPAAAK